MKLRVDGAVRGRAYGPGTGLGAVGRTQRGQAVIRRWAVEPELFGGRPCDCPGCATSAYPSVSLAHSSPGTSLLSRKGETVRAIGLDVHRDFCEVAIAEAGEVRSAGRVAARPDVLEIFAQSLSSDDQVVLEVCGNAWEIARIIEPHVNRVIVVSP